MVEWVIVVLTDVDVEEMEDISPECDAVENGAKLNVVGRVEEEKTPQALPSDSINDGVLMTSTSVDGGGEGEKNTHKHAQDPKMMADKTRLMNNVSSKENAIGR